MIRLCSRPTGTGFSVVISGKHGRNILTLGVSRISHEKGLLVLMKEINVHPEIGGEVVMDEAFAGKTEDISNFF